MKKKILIICHDRIGSSMAGPGIRYHYMAEYLSGDFDVTVGFFDPSYLPEESFQRSYSVESVHSTDFVKGFEGSDIVIALWLSNEMLKFCNENGIFVVFDVYAPVPVENLALFLYNGKSTGADTDYEYRQSFAMYESFFTQGDLFLFSNRRQLDYWTGYVFGTGIVSVSSYKQRPFFDRFIYAPMGIDSSENLKHTKQVMKGAIKGIDMEDKILLWTGGIWNWYDAQTLIRAMKIIGEKRNDIKLVFFGTKHPNPNVPEMQESLDALRIAREYDLLDRNVFFQDGWVPYPERINYLLEADLAVNTSKPSIEAEFSHRTRVLDHILAEIPTIATEGDYLTDEVINRHGLGISVPPNDEQAVADAILHQLKKENYQQTLSRLRKVKDSFDWTSTLAPLKEILISDPPKLKENLHIKKPKKVSSGKHVSIMKTLLPKPVKKAIIRIFKYGQ